MFGPESEYEAGEASAVVHRVLGQLPAATRQVFLMIRVQGTSPREAALALGLTEKAVRRRLERAVDALRKELLR
jgi:RNA polymerase sigma factor (sigma-70 family)